MISQAGSKFVSDKTLEQIQLIAERTGYIKAIQQVLGLPEFDTSRVKERAHWHYVNGPSSFQDLQLLPRSWVKAIEEALCQSGYPIRFSFEIDLLIRSGPDLPEKPDNPT